MEKGIAVQKIKNAIVKKLIDCDASDAELRFLFYIAQYQDNRGNIIGVHYKTICDEIGFSAQTFYNVLSSLQEKNIICFHKNSEIDYDITICNNVFETKQDLKDGYISLRKIVFFHPRFNSLKAKEKLLFIKLFNILQSRGGSWAIGCNTFYEEYSAMFHVTPKVLRGYLKSIRTLLSAKRHNFKYIFELEDYTTINRKECSDDQKMALNIVKACCRRLKIKNATKDEIEDTSNLLHQYDDIAAAQSKNIIILLIECIYESLKKINEFKDLKDKKDYILDPKIIHKAIKVKLNRA